MNIRSTDEFDDLTVWSPSAVRGTVAGHPYTHPGRFDVLWDGADRPNATSLSDLDRVSPPAEMWLSGFLAGQSPGAHEVLPDVGDFLSDADRVEWQAVCHEFQHTGVMPATWMTQRIRLADDDAS